MSGYSLAVSAVAALLMTSACSDGTNYEDYESSSTNHAKTGASTDLTGLKDFTKIVATGPDNVVVTVGQPFKVAAEGKKEALEGLEIKVIDGELRIGRKEGWRNLWSGMGEGVTIHVSMPSIEGAELTGSANIKIDKAEAKALTLEITGSGDLKIDAVKADQVDAEVTGSGDITLAGTAGAVKFQATGSGDIEADGLKAGGGSISVLGSGNVGLASDGAVDIRIMGSGDVDVRGKAQCKVSAMGSGDARCAE